MSYNINLIKRGNMESLEYGVCTIMYKEKGIEVAFPSKIKDQMDIETNKGILSMGKYAILSMNNVASSNRMLDVIDMLSHFTVIVPKFAELVDLKEGQKYTDLDADMLKPFVEQYNEVYAPFYNKFVTKDEMIGSILVVSNSIKAQKAIEDSKGSEKIDPLLVNGEKDKTEDIIEGDD